MRHMILTLAATLAACARSVVPQTAAEANELGGRIAEAPQTCVATAPSQGLRVIDASTIAYGQGRTIYVNRLASACPAISRPSTLIVEDQSGHYCRGDRVRGLQPGDIIAGPSCLLGDWVPYRRR